MITANIFFELGLKIMLFALLPHFFEISPKWGIRILITAIENRGDVWQLCFVVHSLQHDDGSPTENPFKRVGRIHLKLNKNGN